MKAYDLLELAARNLRQSMLRNSLTTIGISVGVASLVSMLSLGVGLQRLASQRISKFGFNTISVFSNRAFNGGRGGGPVSTTSTRALDDAAIKEIARIRNVAEANPDIRFQADAIHDGQTRHTGAMGLADAARTSGTFEALHGAFFSSSNAAEVIVENNFAAELMGKAPQAGRGFGAPANLPGGAAFAKTLVGQEIEIAYTSRVEGSGNIAYTVVSHKQKLKIVAVGDIDPEVRPNFGRSGLFLPQKFAESLRVMQGGDAGFQTVTVRTKDPNQVPAVEATIKKMGFNAISVLDAQKTAQIAFAVVDVFLGVFGSLALAVAFIGIVNTLVMAILERQREIGIMKAIGASDSDIKRIFFAEAGAMGALGGFLGVTMGWLIGRIINFGTNIYFRQQNLPSQDIWYVPWWLVIGALAFSVIVSLAAGSYPATRASRLDPVEALRYQ